MKVLIETRIENEYGFNEEVGYSLETPKHSIRCYNLNEVPEDATLNRDLSFVYSIEFMIQEAFDAGVRGEELVFERKEEE